MKRLIKYVFNFFIYLIIILISGYLTGSLLAWNFNPAQWPLLVRFIIFLPCSTVILFFLIYLVDRAMFIYKNK